MLSRRLCGKLMVSPVKQEMIEKEVAYDFGVMKTAFESGELDEDMMENVDETHFVVNMDNGRTLEFVGCGDVKHADVSSGGQGMTMIYSVQYTTDPPS